MQLSGRTSERGAASMSSVGGHRSYVRGAFADVNSYMLMVAGLRWTGIRVGTY